MEHNNICEISKLEIISPREWLDIALTDKSSVSFSIIGKNIIHSRLMGLLSKESVDNYFIHREKILKQIGLWEISYIDLIDFQSLQGFPSIEVRTAYTWNIINEAKRAKLKGIFVYYINKVTEWIFNIALRINSLPFPVKLYKDYSAAVLSASSISQAIEQSMGIKAGFSVHNQDSLQLQAELENEIDELLKYIGTSNLYDQMVPEFTVPDNNILKPLYEAFSLVKADFYFELQQKKNNDIDLEKEAMYRVLTENLHQFIFTTDKTFQFINGAGDAVYTTGYPAEKLLAMPADYFESLIHANDLIHFKNASENSSNSGSPFTCQLRFKQEAGYYKWMECSYYPLYNGPVWVGFHGVIRNIDDEKCKEEKAHTTNQQLLKTAVNLKTNAVISEITHALGNIINTVNISIDSISRALNKINTENILKANELLVDHLQTLTQPPVENSKVHLLPQYYSQFADNIQHERRIIKDELANLESKLGAINNLIVKQQEQAFDSSMEKYELAMLIEDTVLLQDTLLKKHGIKVISDFEIGRIFLQGDKNKLMLILVNLINRAASSMESVSPEKRVITIRTSKPSANRIMIKITDQGASLSPEDSVHLFESNFKPANMETGFSLHTCYSYIKDMHGKIYAQSHGEGVSIIIEIPYYEK